MLGRFRSSPRSRRVARLAAGPAVFVAFSFACGAPATTITTTTTTTPTPTTSTEPPPGFTVGDLGTFVQIGAPEAEQATAVGQLEPVLTEMEFGDPEINEIEIAFPANGGPITVEGTFVAEETSGAEVLDFTSELGAAIGAYNLVDGSLRAAVRHTVIATQGGQTQTAELSPMLLDGSVDPTTTDLVASLRSESFDYDVVATLDGQLYAFPAGAPETIVGGAFDPSSMERPDAESEVTDNTASAFLTDGSDVFAFGTLSVHYVFTHDSFGVGCEFDGYRAMRFDGTIDPASEEFAGTATVFAWGEVGEACNFETGTAVEENVAASATIDFSSGQVVVTSVPSGTIQNTLELTFTFDGDVLPVPTGSFGKPSAVFAMGSGAMLLGGIAIWLAARRARQMAVLVGPR